MPTPVSYYFKSACTIGGRLSLIIGVFDYKSNYAHSGLDKILYWNKIYNPAEILLTNLSHYIDYYEISKALPNNIKPLYDGYKINI